MEKSIVTEDDIVEWVYKNNGLLFTRKINNMNIEPINNCKPYTLICLTGYTAIVEEFFDKILPNINNKIIIITLETDGFKMKNEYLSNNKIYHWFTWNKQYNHEKLTCIPIGLNKDRHLESLKNFFNKNFSINEKELFAVNLSVASNPDRINLINIAKTKWCSFCNFIENIPYSKSYIQKSNVEGNIKINVTDIKCYEILSRYKFILSPPGEGLDCHRTWEALYCNTIPIIISSSIDELYIDLPVLIVKDWNEINENFLNLKYIEIQNKLKNNEYNIDKLNINYWLNLIKNKIPINTLNQNMKDKYKNIHFMTYANHRFKESKKRLLNEANEFNIFETITSYGPENLSKDFFEKYKEILIQPRGGGYWIWRPFILLDKLNKLNDGEFLIYLDAGCKLNKYGKKRFFEYIDMLDNSEYGIMSFQMTGNSGRGNLEKENVWTNKEIFNYFNIDIESEHGNSGQYLGGILVMKKNKHLLKIIELLIKALEHDSLMFTDYYNSNQYINFKENRHEQSIFSLLRKIHGSVVIKNDESWMVPFGKGESLKYPFWATRIKG